MALSRRHFLNLLPAGIISNAFAVESQKFSSDPGSKELFVSSGVNSLENHSLFAFTRDGLCQPIYDLPSRGHGFCLVESNEENKPCLIAVARRPADYFVVLQKGW